MDFPNWTEPRIMLKVFWVTSIFLLCCHVNGESYTATGDPWAPFLHPEEHNDGVAYQIVKEAFSNQGHDLKLTYLPWKRAMLEVSESNIDILLTTWYSDERAKTYIYSQPYLKNEIVFIKHAESDDTYHSVDDLAGKQVAIKRGYDFGKEVLAAKNFTLIEIDSLFNSLSMLATERIDVVIADKIAAKIEIQKLKPKIANNIQFTNFILDSKDLSIVVSKNNPNAKEIIRAFNQGLNSIQESGKLDALLKSTPLSTD